MASSPQVAPASTSAPGSSGISRTPIVVHGASGRMGREVQALLAAAPDLELLATVGREAWPALPGTAVVVDFSLPEALPALLERCRSAGLALVSGTTGLDAAAERQLDALAEFVPVLWAPNFSLGVALLQQALAELAARLPAGWDSAVIDLHHRHKRDAPSGTALALAQCIDAARPGAAATTVISARLGEINGEHRIVLAGASERLELVHHADHRRLFAEGALHAARWLHGRPPGRYVLAQTLDARQRGQMESG